MFLNSGLEKFEDDDSTSTKIGSGVSGRTGDPVFDTQFRVRCSDEYLARRLVSRRFVAQMLGLHEKFLSGRRPLSVALQSDKLLAKVSTARDQTTEFPLAPRDDHFENLKNFATQLAYLLDMIDCPSRRGHYCAPPLTDPSERNSRTRFLT